MPCSYLLDPLALYLILRLLMLQHLVNGQLLLLSLASRTQRGSEVSQTSLLLLFEDP